MNRIASVSWMLLWSLSFSTAMSLTKNLTADTSPLMIVFIRSVFGMILLTPLVMRSGLKNILTKRPFHHLARILISSLAMICTYYVYSHLPLATASSIGFIGPSISVLLAMFVFSEKVGLGKWAFIFLGYSGVLILVHPGHMEFHPAILVSILGSILGSTSILLAKFLSKDESAEQITFINNSGRIILLGALSFMFWKTPALEDWMLLALIGLAGTISQYSYIRALKNGVVSLVAPFEYTRLVFAVPIGILFFSEIPTVWTFVGSMVIILSNFGLTFIDNYRQSKKEDLQEV